MLHGRFQNEKYYIRVDIIYVDSDDRLRKYYHSQKEQLMTHKATPDKLGTAEQLYLRLSSIPRMEARIRAMNFRAEFKEKIDFVKPVLPSAIGNCGGQLWGATVGGNCGVLFV